MSFFSCYFGSQISGHLSILAANQTIVLMVMLLIHVRTEITSALGHLLGYLSVATVRRPFNALS